MFFRKKNAPEGDKGALPDSGTGSTDGSAADSPKEPEKKGLFARLAKSRDSIGRSIGALLGRRKPIDDQLFTDLEDELIIADLGVDVASEVIEQLRRQVREENIDSSTGLLTALRGQLTSILEPVAVALPVPEVSRDHDSNSEPTTDTRSVTQPFVVMMVGVNGVGKTTSTAKLAAQYKGQGHNVMLAACDTFRAAAIEQLQTWAQRIDVPIVAQAHGSDAAAVAHDALQSAQARQISLLLVDTAGRQHTSGDLMEQLGKVKRVMAKLDASAPQEILLTVDAATGQNALTQVEQFNAQVPLTGLIVTKLDGTAKGGIIIALARRFGLPIRYIGVGESVDDLRLFNPQEFVDALLPDNVIDEQDD